MDYSNDNKGLRPSTELDDGFIEQIKTSYKSQTLPVSIIAFIICVFLTVLIAVTSFYTYVTMAILIISLVMGLFLFARIIAILIIAGRIRRDGFSWTRGTVTGYAWEGTRRNYHIYVKVNELLYCMLWMNNPYSKGTDVFVLSMKIFTSEEYIMVCGL